MPNELRLDPAFFWDAVAKSSLGFALTALVVCVFMAAIVVGMLSHAETQSGRARTVLLAMIATVAGVGVWTTHFVAMLGFRPDFRLGYDPFLTLVSLAVGVAAVGGPLAAVALVRPVWGRAALGAVAGAGVGAMHFTGMGALQGCLAAYDPAVTALALVLGMLAIAVAASAGSRRRLVRGGLIVLGVCLLHFTAMAAVTLQAAPRAGLQPVEPVALSAFVALASLLLSAAAFASVTATARLDAQARAAAAAEARQRDVLSAALHNMTNGLVMIDRDGRISLYNDRTLELLGLEPDEVAIGMPLADYVGNIGRRNGWSRAETEGVLARRLEIISKAASTRLDQQYADGTILSIACQPMPGGGAILTYDDLTEARAARAEIEYMAYHDALTGLPNRRYLAEKMRDLVLQGPSGGMAALLHVDLDRFKQINDSLGHAAGDKVLCHVANVLRDAVRRTDVAVRVGGDEFVVFCDAATELSSLTRMAQRIIDALARPLAIDGDVCHFGASVGIAREKLDGLDCDTLMSRADIALYDAKRAGRGRLSVFTEAMKEQALAAGHLRDDVRRGIEAGEFFGVYHPQFDARTLDLVGVEARARWNHPLRGVLAPDAFAAIADELGLVDAIDEAILACAVRDRARWIAAGLDVRKISVNVSARRLRGAALVETVRALDLPRGVVAFELLESIDLDEPDAISAFNIDGLRDLGVGIEIDDFGTGRTSIVSLVRLRPDRLKIDRQLVAPIVRSAAALNLVASIVEIGRTLGIGVTAEGVETAAQAETLRGIGCDTLQGCAFTKPLPADALAAFLSAEGWRATIRRQGDAAVAGRGGERRPVWSVRQGTTRREGVSGMDVFEKPPQDQDRQPGLEAETEPRPDFAPRFRGSDRLAGKTALITGGDSGIGRATAVLFAREGANVAIHYKDEHADAARTLELIRAEGAQGLAISGDLGVKAQAEHAVRETIEAFGGVDVLVNNAAEQHAQEDVTAITQDQLERTFATNIFAQFYMVQAVLPQMKRGDAIVNVTSVTAFRGQDLLIDYAASKGAILAFTRALSSSLAERGIRVNAVAPGPIWTPLIPASFPPEKVARFGEDAKLGRAGQPNEVAPSILFLASEDGSYMTGQTLHPNGGDLVGG